MRNLLCTIALIAGVVVISDSNFLPRMESASSHAFSRSAWTARVTPRHARLPPARQCRALTVGIALSGEGHFTFGPQIETLRALAKDGTELSRD